MLSGVCSSTMSFMIGGEERKYTIQWLTQGGVLLFIGSFRGWIKYKARVKDLLVLLWRSVVQLRKTIVTVICLVGFSSIMETSGMINQLAVALSAATGALYPLFAPNDWGLGYIPDGKRHFGEHLVG